MLDAVTQLERRVGAPVPVLQLGAGTDVADHAMRVGAGAVVALPGSGLDAASLRRLQWHLEGEQLPFFVDPGVLGVASARMAPTRIGGHAVLRVHSAPRRGPSWALIGWCGRIAAAVSLVLLLPLLLAIGIAIARTSPGPVIYRQARVGQDGRAFTLYKFRTMVDGPYAGTLENEADQVLFKMRADPRVTPLGRWLRRYSLDELPQLANVALGQMRLIGPRPALADEVADYDEDARRRLAVTPGMTGLWQVSGRSDLSWEESVSLDLQYVDNWSPLLDLTILVRTVGAVLGHRGAY